MVRSGSQQRAAEVVKVCTNTGSCYSTCRLLVRQSEWKSYRAVLTCWQTPSIRDEPPGVKYRISMGTNEVIRHRFLYGPGTVLTSISAL
jgi:hypothetical protein